MNKPKISNNSPSTREFKNIKVICDIRKKHSLFLSKWITTKNILSRDDLFRNEKFLNKLRHKDTYNWFHRINDMEKFICI